MSYREDLEIELKRMIKRGNFVQEVSAYIWKHMPKVATQNDEHMLNGMLVRMRVKPGEDTETRVIEIASKFVRSKRTALKNMQAAEKAAKERHRNEIKAMLAVKGNRW